MQMLTGTLQGKGLGKGEGCVTPSRPCAGWLAAPLSKVTLSYQQKPCSRNSSILSRRKMTHENMSGPLGVCHKSLKL